MHFAHDHHHQHHHRRRFWSRGQAHEQAPEQAREHECGAGGFRRRHFGREWHEDSGEGHGGRRRLFDSRELRLVLLKLIADQPRHGYDLIRAIEELTGGSYVPSPGVVYPALSILQDLGHIEASESEGARKAFAVTPDGTAELVANADKVAALFARLGELAARRERMDIVPIRRAMENLRAVLRHRLGRESAGKSTLHDVAAILDDAAQRIERL